MELYSIASGSSGNCVYIGQEDTGILVDAGISKKRIKEGLEQIQKSPEHLKGILVTHEHSDHIKGLGVMARGYHIPIYGTLETLDAIRECGSLGKIDEDLYRPILPDKAFKIDDLEINPFSISHDAANPVCYTFTNGEKKMGVATDMGCYDSYIIEQLSGCEALLLEANHDVNMLQVGPYPYSLKQRILGDRGHLSNDNSGKLLGNLIEQGLKYIYLGHLSKENNYPELAYETVKYELQKCFGVDCREYSMRVASRETPSPMVSI